jgi:hypothetical protein
MQTKSNAKLHVARHSKEAFESFVVPEDRIEAALKAFYSM